MALIAFKDLCVDASDVSMVAGFWARHLGLDRAKAGGSDEVLRGERPEQSVWVNQVPEARTGKNRVHLDLRADSLEPFAGLRRVTELGQFDWTVFEDPEGGEFCVFLNRGPDDPRPLGLKSVGVDASDPARIAGWWADLLGGRLEHDDGYSSVEDVPGGVPESIDFAAVPEPKTVKNRWHWDVTLTDGSTVTDLERAGATTLAAPAAQQSWTVMADPEGNEFCVFDGASTGVSVRHGGMRTCPSI